MLIVYHEQSLIWSLRQSQGSCYYYSDEDSEAQRGKETIQGQTAGVNGRVRMQTQVSLILVLGSQTGYLKDRMGEDTQEDPQVEKGATDKF